MKYEPFLSRNIFSLLTLFIEKYPQGTQKCRFDVWWWYCFYYVAQKTKETCFKGDERINGLIKDFVEFLMCLFKPKLHVDVVSFDVHSKYLN